MTTRYIYDIPNTDPMGWLDIRFKRVSSSLVGLYDASSVLKSLTCQGLTLGNSSVLSHTDGYNYLRGDVTSFQDAGGTTRSAIYPTVGRQTWTFGTSYAQIDAGAAGINTHASLSLVTSLGSVNLFNWHTDGKTYLDASGEFDIRVAGTTRFRINAAGLTQINGASNSGMPVTIKGPASFEHSASTAQNIVLSPDASQVQLLSASGVTSLFNYSGDGKTYLDSTGFILRANGSEAVTGLGAGRVMIGTPGSDPGARFTVGGNSSFQGNVDVTGTLSAAVFTPNYIRIPGASAVTGTYVLATIGDNVVGFSGANDADSKHLVEHKACSYQVNGGSVETYTGVRYGMVKEGTWNLGGGGTQVGGAFIVETSSGGSLVTLPTLTERLRIGSDGKATFTVTGNATRSIAALFKNTGDIVGAGNDYENEVHVVLQAGTSANHRRYIDWKNYNGTDAYLMGVNAGGAFIWYDSALGHRIHMHPDGYTQINSFGTYAVEINNYPGSDTLGTGGLAVYSGGILAGRKKILTVGESASSDVRLDGRFFWGGSLNNEVGRMTYSGIDAYIDAFQDGGVLYLRNNVGGSLVQAVSITSTIANFADKVYCNSEFRVNGGATYSRVAQMDGAGGFGGGYNFNVTSGGSRDSTGTVAGYIYTGSTCRFYAENSGAAGVISPKFQIATAETTVYNMLVLTTSTPASASATGTAGSLAWDGSYIYVCTATDTWKRVAISTW